MQITRQSQGRKGFSLVSLRSCSIGMTVGFSLMLLATLPARAQLGSGGSNGSDRTGVITTTSDVAGGAFAPNSSGETTFSSPDVTAAVEQIAASLSTQLSGGALAVAASDIPGTSIPTSVQQALLSLLTGNANAAAVSNEIQLALINAPGVADTAETTTLVKDLTTKLQGLIVDSRVSATALRAAVEAYNAVIDKSSPETLTNPPPELLAIRAVLNKLVNAALAQK